MSQSPITVTYPLETSLTRIEGKIDTLQKEVTDLKVEVAEIKTEFKVEVAEVKGEMKALNEKLTGMDVRLKSVEGTQKNQVWTLIILLVGAIATAGFKAFFAGNNP
jgi:seryl-tRNA synthetase